jgi:Kef-type K+ transport system membrane component KefB
MRPALTLAGLILLAWIAMHSYLPGFSGESSQTTWSLGFLLLAAFTLGELLARLKLPRITGYLIAGLLFGPHVFGFLSKETVASLRLIDSLALTFIALSAGGELRWKDLLEHRKRIAWSIVGLMSVIFLLSTGLFLALRGIFSFTRELDFLSVLVMAMVLGAIATARSPASAIAIIRETGARGAFTEVVFGVTVAMDILAIMLFALVVSLGQTLLTGQALDGGFLLGLLLEILGSLALGSLIGVGLAAWLKKVQGYHLVTIFLLAILVTELSQFLGSALETRFGLHFHLEPMLICIATGFVVRNFSSQGARFLEVLDEGGLMVYAIFFALAGAALDLDILKSSWALALVLVVIRGIAVQAGAWTGMTLARAPAIHRKIFGMTFITQAGVSLGLAKAVEIRFPEWGAALATLAVATISLNQLIGPVLFKKALEISGESSKA